MLLACEPPCPTDEEIAPVEAECTVDADCVPVMSCYSVCMHPLWVVAPRGDEERARRRNSGCCGDTRLLLYCSGFAEPSAVCADAACMLIGEDGVPVRRLVMGIPADG